MSWIITYPPEYYLKLGGEEQQTRWVYNFNGVDSHINIDQFSIGTNDSISFTFESIAGAGFRTVLAGSNCRLQRRTVGASEILAFNYKNSVGAVLNALFTALPLTPGSTISAELKMVVGGVELFINGESSFVSMVIDDALLVSRIGMDGVSSIGGADAFSGKLYDVKVNDGSVYNYPINDRTFGAGAPIANSATVLGSELLFNNDFSSQGSGWNVQDGVSFANGLLVYDGVKNDVIWQNVNVEANTTYIFEIKVINVIRNGGNQPRVQIANGGYLPVRAVSDGAYRVLLESSVNGSNPLYIELGAFGSGAAFSVDYVSLKKADGYATGVNLLESGWEEITL